MAAVMGTALDDKGARRLVYRHLCRHGSRRVCLQAIHTVDC